MLLGESQALDSLASSACAMGWPKGRGAGSSPARGASRSPHRTVRSATLAAVLGTDTSCMRADRVVQMALDCVAETSESQTSAGRAFIAAGRALLESFRVHDFGQAPPSPEVRCSVCGAAWPSAIADAAAAAAAAQAAAAAAAPAQAPRTDADDVDEQG